MIVVDVACGLRDALPARAGRDREGRLPSRRALTACIAAVVVVCVPVLAANTLLLIALVGNLLG